MILGTIRYFKNLHFLHGRWCIRLPFTCSTFPIRCVRLAKLCPKGLPSWCLTEPLTRTVPPHPRSKRNTTTGSSVVNLPELLSLLVLNLTYWDTGHAIKPFIAYDVLQFTFNLREVFKDASVTSRQVEHNHWKGYNLIAVFFLQIHRYIFHVKFEFQIIMRVEMCSLSRSNIILDFQAVFRSSLLLGCIYCK